MISVLHICTDFWPSTGGIENFVLSLAKRSNASGFRASVLCFDRINGGTRALAAQDSIEGVSVTRIPYIDLKFYKPTWLPLPLLRSNDIIHVHGVGAPLDYAVITKLLHRRPIIVSTHGGIFHTKTLLPLKRLYFFGVARAALKGVDSVVACSSSDEVLFRRISDRVVLIENAVSIDEHLRLPLARKVPGRCLYVGRLSQNKGVPSLLHAFAEAKRMGAQFCLRLVGPDREGRSREYRALAQSLGIDQEVCFVGEVGDAELLSEYEQAENFVSASTYEGFGLSALEARAAGCRLMVQANEAFISLFAKDSGAHLIDFSKHQAAGAVVQKLLALRPSHSEPNERRDVARYSWEIKIREWQALYEQKVQPTKLTSIV